MFLGLTFELEAPPWFSLSNQLLLLLLGCELAETYRTKEIRFFTEVLAQSLTAALHHWYHFS